MKPLDRKKLESAATSEICAVQEILRLWDPINVRPGTLAPLDEYDSYAPHIVSMVKGGCTIEELAAHLEHLGADTLGIGPSSAESRAHSLKFATQIVSQLR